MYNTADIHLALPERVFQASASQGLCPLGQRKGWSCEEGSQTTTNYRREWMTTLGQFWRANPSHHNCLA